MANVLVAVIGVAGAGIGGLGFVAAVGGIVTQARFRGAGLPAEQSVAVETRGVLVAVGGEVLAVAVLTALVLVAAVHWWPELAAEAKRVAQWLQTVARPHSEPAPSGPSWRWWIVAALIGLVTLADYFLGWWAGQVIDSGDHVWLFGDVLLVAIIGAAVTTVLAKRASEHRGDIQGEGLRLLGLFLVVACLGGIAAAAGSLANPQIRPAALLLSRPSEAVCGLYVGQTQDRVYVGEATPQKGNEDLGDHSMGYIVEAARGRVQRLFIGASQSLSDALRTAKKSLYEHLGAGTATPPLGC